VNTWHVTPDVLTAYRGDGDTILAASVEAHLMSCVACRKALAESGGSRAAAETERRWSSLTDVVDRPRSSPLARIGVSTPPLRLAWVAALLLVFVVPVLVRLIVGAAVPTLLLALAPIAPSIAVALAYREVADPAGEMALAAPMAGLRLISARALLVGAVAAPVGVLAAFLLGLPLHVAVAWLLPGLALSALVLLAGTTRLDPGVVAGVLGVAWALGVAGPSATRRIPADVVADQVAGAPVQLIALAIATAALALAVSRREQVAYRRYA